MSLSALIERNKNVILPELYAWAETFRLSDFPSRFDEEEDNSFDEVWSLAERLDNGQCTEDDYEEIIFHIEQINYNETKINLTI
jgi:hypothetical protein